MLQSRENVGATHCDVWNKSILSTAQCRSHDYLANCILLQRCNNNIITPQRKLQSSREIPVCTRPGNDPTGKRLQPRKLSIFVQTICSPLTHVPGSCLWTSGLFCAVTEFFSSDCVACGKIGETCLRQSEPASTSLHIHLSVSTTELQPCA